jgi:DNA-binding NarL/FixJ family response regulator
MSDRPPFVVLDAASEEALARAVAWVAADGYRTRAGFGQVPLNAERLVCHGIVRTPEDAGEALLAATWGVGLVVGVAAGSATRDALVADLERIGPVLRSLPEERRGRLGDEEDALLGLLAAGMSLGDAARRLHLSRRTADRRLARARRSLGVTTTAEALVAWRRVG